ncbi:MAG: glycerate kinase [Bacteroidales bacterium]|nr:glycerate kinase [Bacteroidales bacterium]MBN2764436.1 glycerate kinase [Bacteroidales bacterium]
MRILICPDSFKECLTARQVAEHIASGIQRILPSADIKIIPLADGGEGTVAALMHTTEGRIVNVEVHDPLMRTIHSFFGLTGDGETALIEMASASGLELLKPYERNPLITSSFGTGELIKYALDEGCKRIIVGMGGSATNDGGMGAVMALGVKFYDKKGGELPQGGGSLDQLAGIDMKGMDERIHKCRIDVACDVDNPLTGENGASLVYGLQKGGDTAMAEQLDRNLQLFARKIKDSLGRDIEHVPGSGAAGGLGGGMMAFFNAKIRPGFNLISEYIDLEKYIGSADLIITGEGRIDFQTQFGKTPVGVAFLAKKHNKPVIAVAGTLGRGYEVLYEKGIQCFVPIVDKPVSLEVSIRDAGYLLEQTAERISRMLQLGISLKGIF